MKWLRLGTGMVLILSLILLSACNARVFLSNEFQTTGTYPSKPITGVIPWDQGGTTDSIARTISPLVEKELGQSIVLTNKPGATGSIGTHYVYEQEPDGTHLLFSAENPALYGVLDISALGFDDFEPIALYARTMATVVVPADSKYKTLDDLLQDAKARPGKIKMGSTGPGGLPHVVSSMINGAAGTRFNLIPFPGDGPALTALLGGHIDATVSALSAAINNQKAGKVRILAVINDQPVPAIPDVPTVTQSLPQLEQHLPWGPFFGVWVKKGTPEPIKAKLAKAFAKAEETPKFQKALRNIGAIPMNLHGKEAERYWRDWQSTTAWLIYEGGEAKVHPAKLNIPKKPSRSDQER